MAIGFYYEKSFDNDLNFFAYIVLFFFSFIILCLNVNKNKSLFLEAFIVSSPLILFLLPGFIETTNYGYAIDKAIGFWLLPLIISIVFLINTNRFGISAISKLVGMLFLILILTVLYKLYAGFFVRSARYLVNGSIVFSWLMGLASIFSFYLAENHTHSSKERNKYFLLTIAFCLAVIWGFSKGPILALVISFIYIFLISKLSFKRLVCFTALILLFSILVFYYKDIPAIARMLNVLINDEGVTEVSSVKARYQLYSLTLELIKTHPLTGVGLGEWSSHISYGGAIYPHNIILEIAAELGVLVLFFYAVYSFLLISNTNKLFRALILYTFICLFFSGDLTYFRILNFLIISGYLFSRRGTFNGIYNIRAR
jgi:hypothetical protein